MNCRHFQGTLEELTTLGWSISQKSFSEQLKKVDNGNRREFLTLLLDSDLREFGVPWIADHKKQEQLDAGGRIVQVVRCRNIAIPLADEDHTNLTGPYTGPRLLRLALTDGRSTVTALDVDNNERLSMNTPPGTKLRLMGTIPLCLGFLILQKQHVQVLGGNVANLIKEWTMTKLAKDCEGRLRSGAPPFVPFGSHEAADLVQSECRFLSSLNVMRNPEGGYDSFKTASKSTAAEKGNEFDAGFMERRKDIIAEVQQTKCENSSAADSVKKPAYMRFQTGGSKFADLQAEKTQAYDEALAQLVSLNYPMPLAASALKLHKGDYKAALDYLLAKQISSTNLNGRGAGLRSTRRRGGRPSRGGISGPDEEDDPRFDPVAAAAAAGLPRHSAGLTRLSDLLPVTMTNHVNTAPSASNSRPSVCGRTPICLPVGCPILAQNMAGEYEEAQLIGHITSPGASASGDKVVLVVYTQRSNNGPQDEQEELVPLSLIRTLNNEKVSLDMVPPAPPHRARPYNPSTISSGAPSYNPHSKDLQSGQFDGNPSRGRFGRPRGRSATTGRGGRPRRFGGGRSGRPPY
ncbi:tudor domain-containing protein 3 [Clonorchis sinensis]|uniref:Tudor domain-containing protein 3 n=1 Tax=Clonorchis sinensis TaxID=79923 RepID=A0A419PVL2_CLOSI|nr:tudor domain-containing protein 3 [Clonorchis sinensis]